MFTSLFNHMFARRNTPKRHRPAAAELDTSARATGWPATARVPQVGNISAAAETLNTSFYGLLLGAHSPLECELNRLEQRVISEITAVLSAKRSHSDLVPRLPSIMPKIMKALRDEEASTAELAAHIGRDVVLVSEVIRLANSPYYRIAKKIDSLERAIHILGRNGIRQLVANAAFKPLIDMKVGHFTQLSGSIIWELSERSAVLCDCIAKRKRADPFNAYLAGLVHNVGFTIALRILDRVYDGSDALRSNAFRMLLIDQATILSLMIAQEWAFPQAVLDALEHQIGKFKFDEASPLAQILYTSDVLAKLNILSERQEFAHTTERVKVQLTPLMTSIYAACYGKLTPDEP